jgi:uncharacterized membrane protein YgcG
MKSEMQMFRINSLAVWMIAPLMLLAAGTLASAASNGVRDEVHFFSPAAIDQANQIIQQIDEKRGKDLLIETVPQISPDMKSQFDQQGKNQFFEQWARTRAQSQGVNGVYVLICKDPPHIQVEVGNKTRQKLFTMADRDRMLQILISAFRGKQYDQGLLEAARLVQQRMDANAAAAGTAVAPPGSSMPPPYNYRSNPRTGFGIGGIACLVIGVILLVVMLRGIFGRSGGSYYGGQGGGYYPQGGAYPPAGGYSPGGGGGGFGQGFLGGLLGGAVGGYAADRWMHGGQQQGGYASPPTGGGQDSSSGPDTSFSGTGGDFGGGGGGGGDFGGGGGGGDFGSGGGDSGGSGGGDF